MQVTARRRKSDWIAVLVLALSPATGGCDDRPAASSLQGVTGRDSAGVLLVSLADLVSGGARDLQAVTEATSRIDGGTEPLFGVVTAFALSGGTGSDVAVVDRGSHSIRVFGADGAEVRRFGGPGDGPGEFRDLTAAGPMGMDSVWAFDFLAQRLTVFGPEGGPRTVRVETGLPYRTLIGRLGHDFVAIESPVTTGATESGLHRDSLDLDLVSGTDGRVMNLGRFTGSDVFLEITQRGDGISVSKSTIPEGYATLHAIVGGQLATVRTEAYRLEFRGPDGTVERVVEGDLRGRRIDSGYHDRVPVLEDLVAGASRDGRPAAWLRLASMPDDSLAVWLAHGTDGAVIDGARLPAGLRLTDVTTDRFIGVMTDELGVERVAVFGRQGCVRQHVAAAFCPLVATNL